MKVWLVSVNEPTPLDGLRGRLWRTGLTSELLADLGHDVVWWVSNFRHLTKDFRVSEPTMVHRPEGYRMRVLPALGYERHISLQRLRDHRFVARKFVEVANDLEPPDLILASYPTIDVCHAAVRYGRRHGVPVVVDVRDQWPDTFLGAFPSPVRWLVKTLTYPLSRQADYVFREATAITGNGPNAVAWALERAGREWSDLDAHFPMGYPELEFSQDELEEAMAYWSDQGLMGEDGEFVAAFLGSISRHFDFETVLAAARSLSDSEAPMKFVFCGTGDRLDALRAEYEEFPEILFTGWVEAPALHALLNRASVGLAPYRSDANFQDGITNKPIEYMSAGLPIATTLQRGILHDLLVDNDCGLFYSTGDSAGLSRALEDLRQHPARLAQMRANARDLYERSFTAKSVYGAMIAHLEKIVDDPHVAEERSE